MARMHSRKKGKSGSKKPLEKKKKAWIRYSAKEVESLVVKLSKSGNSQGKIGLILRDAYGIPDVRIITKKRIGAILKENQIKTELPEDLMFLIKKQIELMKHLEANKKDFSAKRGLQLTESKINRLVHYYKRNNRLDSNWSYDKTKAKLLIS